MLKSKLNILQPSFFGNVSFMLLAYWAILVIWQNVNNVGTRTTLDIAIKISLLLFFVAFYVINSNNVSQKLIGVVIFSASLIITLFFESQINLNTIIAYVYPILMLAMVYGLGDNFQINQKHLIAFCNGIIMLVLYAVIYAFIFCTDQFASAFSSGGAYGNELSSFFISSHEYGMYLVYAIASCLICLKFKEKQDALQKLPYIVAIIVIIPNLVLTFSRTSMLAAALMLVFYAVFSKDRKIQITLISVVFVVVVAVAVSPTLQEFVFMKIFKENNMAGRDDLLSYAWRFYEDGNPIQKLFGRGITESRAFLDAETDHGSVHNAYVQVLIYYGIVGLASLVTFLSVQIWNCVRLIKKDRFIGAMCLGIIVSAAAMMFTNTAIIFTTPIDCYFVTVFAIVVPKYIRNAIYSNRFYLN